MEVEVIFNVLEYNESINKTKYHLLSPLGKNIKEEKVTRSRSHAVSVMLLLVLFPGGACAVGRASEGDRMGSCAGAAVAPWWPSYSTGSPVRRRLSSDFRLLRA